LDRDPRIGYSEEPEDGYGIIRARTTGLLRSWEFDRNDSILEQFNNQIQRIEYPGLYALFEGKNKVYVGESKNIYERTKEHINNPDEKCNKWARVLILNDGRPSTQSDLNDASVRKQLEWYLGILFKANGYIVVSRGDEQSLNPSQLHTTSSFIEELNYFLMRKNRIKHLLETTGQEKVFARDLKKRLEKKGYRVDKFKAVECKLNGESAFIRPGSKKPKGWQVTIRGGKEGSFLDCLRKADGHLIVSRNGILVIPMKFIRDFVNDPKAIARDTVDIFFQFEPNEVWLVYKNNKTEASEFLLTR
jgi:hypothetical protein